MKRALKLTFNPKTMFIAIPLRQLLKKERMKLFLSLFCLSLSFGLSAQLAPEPEKVKTSCFTVGYLQGGGSMIGVDFEAVIQNQLSAQLGAGLYGFGFGVNYHLTNVFRS